MFDNIFKIVSKNANRLSVDPYKAFYNALRFSVFVGHIENNGKLTGSNPTSTAKGLYQFLDGSIAPALNRLERYLHEPFMDTLRVTKDMNGLCWEEQTQVFLADILEKKGSDKYMVGVLKGDLEAMRQAYCVLHHTNPDAATYARVAKIIVEG